MEGGREGGRDGEREEGREEGRKGRREWGREVGREGGREGGGRKHTAYTYIIMYMMYLYTCISPPVRLCSYPDILVALLQLHTHSSLCHNLLCRETPALYDDSVLDVF